MSYALVIALTPAERDRLVELLEATAVDDLGESLLRTSRHQPMPSSGGQP